MGCGGSTAKDTGSARNEAKYCESKVSEEKKVAEEAQPLPVPVVTKHESEEGSGKGDQEVASPVSHNNGGGAGVVSSPPQHMVAVDSPPQNNSASPAQPSIDTGRADPDLTINRTASGSKVSQSSATLGSTSQAVTSTNSDEEVDSDEQVMKMIIKLKEQAINEARKLGSTDIKLGSTPLRSVGGPVELSPKDLQRIRKWADFTPPFEPILAPPDATETGRQPRENTLKVNQELLDSYERDRRIQTTGAAASPVAKKDSRTVQRENSRQERAAAAAAAATSATLMSTPAPEKESRSNVAEMAASPVNDGSRNIALTTERSPPPENDGTPEQQQVQKGTPPPEVAEQRQGED